MPFRANEALHADVPAPPYALMANTLRFLAADAVEAAKSGHPGMPMGMADVATVLFSRFLKFDPARPTWADRDRFVLSGGHGSMLLYALAHLTGYEGMPMAELKNFRQLHSKTPGHPEIMPSVGIETTTGPLGQGLATAVGMALAERVMAARYGEDVVNHRTWVMVGDGDLMEGISHEAASLAGHWGLGKLVVFYDDNQISIDGPTSLSFSEDTAERFRSYGWFVMQVNGHDPEAIAQVIQKAMRSNLPALISCRTTIGMGAPTKGGTHHCHGAPLGADEIAAMREKLNWSYAPFEVPDAALAAWRDAGLRSAAEVAAWDQRLAASPKKADFEAALAGKLPALAQAALTELKTKMAAEKPKLATRQSSGAVLDALVPVWENLLGGSADLTPSNNTQAKGTGAITKANNYQGRYIHYGVREFGMAAAMNGLAVHGGFVPYGGTFLIFSDYCRSAIRLSALMRQRVVYVMTHDSIGLGEDGPTHQPIEHLASLRAMPGLAVMRPADTVETAECWELALSQVAGPSLLALSRQAVPAYRGDAGENRSAKGAYVLAEAEGPRQVTLLATGTEVSLAMEAQTKLKEQGIQAAVVSMPCWELFEAQDAAYRTAVLGSAPRIAIEAAARLGWDRWIGDNGVFIGMTSFGDSAPAPALYKHFGITVEAVVDAASRLVGK
jgi:transketolase